MLMLFRKCDLLKNSLRHAHYISGRDNHLSIRRLYEDAITVSTHDPNITAEYAINKGFAYLAFVDENGRKQESWSAQECFELATKLDTQNKYKDVISIEIEQA